MYRSKQSTHSFPRHKVRSQNMQRKGLLIASVILLFSFVIVLASATANAAMAEPTTEKSTNAAVTRYVAPSGSNTGPCTEPSTPCQSVQYAVNQSATGDTILVAAGRYTYDNNFDTTCARNLGTTAVVCLINKNLTLLGGYSAGNWSTANPTANETIIDGGNTYRGLLTLATDNSGGITLDGFTIQNGVARGIAARSDLLSKISAFGGGVYIDFSTGILKNLVFKNNQSIGENTSSAFGGPGNGGALAITSATSEVTLSDLTFLNNAAIGGTGVDRGGFAIGGAVFTFNSVVAGQNLHFEGNTATAGATNGAGRADGEFADAQGAALAAQQGSTVTLTNVTATNNTARGGEAPNGDAGGAYGGALYAEEANLSVYNADIRGNLAQGATGINDAAASSGSGLAEGGGILTFNSNVLLDRVSVINNRAKGGDGRTYQGPVGGGGVGLMAASSAYGATLLNTVIAGNRVEFGSGASPVGGGGGGLWIQGINVVGKHLTLADNELTDIHMYGEAAIMLNFGNASPVFDLSDSIIANHTSMAGRNALEPIQTATLNLNRGLFANNGGKNTNSGEPDSGTTTGLPTMLTASTAHFISASSPSYDYRISGSSAAKDQATGSTIAVDRNNTTRDGNPDFGAYEADGFTATVSAIESGTLRVSWRPRADASAYTITVTCPTGGNSPEQGACGSAIRVPTSATEFLLTGLSNYERYAIEVAIVTNNGVTESVIAQATPTDIFYYLPVVGQ